MFYLLSHKFADVAFFVTFADFDFPFDVVRSLQAGIQAFKRAVFLFKDNTSVTHSNKTRKKCYFSLIELLVRKYRL